MATPSSILPGESHGRSSLAGYGPHTTGCTQLKRLSMHAHCSQLSCVHHEYLCSVFRIVFLGFLEAGLLKQRNLMNIFQGQLQMAFWKGCSGWLVHTNNVGRILGNLFYTAIVPVALKVGFQPVSSCVNWGRWVEVLLCLTCSLFARDSLSPATLPNSCCTAIIILQAEIQTCCK